MIIDNIVKEQVNQLWTEFHDKSFCKYSPTAVKELPDEGLIFIGLNPSISERQVISTEILDTKCVFYDQPSSKHNLHLYFRKFFDISEIVGMPWGHFDLLYMRETEQNKIEEMIKDLSERDFIYKQLLISKQIIDRLLNSGKNYIFVVNNTLARRFLGKDKHESTNVWLDYNFSKDSYKELGTYQCCNYPFFFTSMLTGQRALDNGSFERLIWHIEYVKNKKYA